MGHSRIIISILRIDLLRGFVLALVLFAGIACFAKVAHYAASVPYLEIEPHWHLTRSGGSAILFVQVMNLLPQPVRVIAIMWAPTIIVLITAPGLWSYLCKLYNRSQYAVFSATGVAMLRDCAYHQFAWAELEKVELARPNRLWRMTRTAIKLFFSSQTPARRVATLREWLVHIVSLNWLLGRQVRIIDLDLNLLLSTEMHDFNPREVLKFIGRFRPELVEKIGLPQAHEGPAPNFTN